MCCDQGALDLMCDADPRISEHVQKKFLTAQEAGSKLALVLNVFSFYGG